MSMKFEFKYFDGGVYVVKVYMTQKFIRLFERVFKMMKNSVYLL